MPKRKLLTLVTAVALVLICSVSMTFSYISATSTTLTNKLDTPSTKVEQEEREWNSDEPHPLVPGQVYAKNPTATLKTGSVPSYVFMEVTASTALRSILDGTAGENVEIRYPSVNSDWMRIKGEEGDSTFVYAYTGTALGGIEDVSEEDIVLPALFDEIKIKAGATDDDLKAALGGSGNDAKIEIVTKACQTVGFANAVEAYEAVFGVTPSTGGEQE